MEHGDGSTHLYKIPVPSLPIAQFSEQLQAAIEAAPVQGFRGNLFIQNNQQELKSKIKFILKRRNMYTDAYKESWRSFLRRLPNEDSDYRPNEHPNVLCELMGLYGRKRNIRPTFQPVEADLDDYGEIDVIQYQGGPMDHNEHTSYRRKIKDGERGCIRKRRKNKGKLSDSSDDDNDVGEDNPPKKKRNLGGREKKPRVAEVVGVGRIPNLDDIHITILDEHKDVDCGKISSASRNSQKTFNHENSTMKQSGSSYNNATALDCSSPNGNAPPSTHCMNGIEIDVGRFQECVDNSVGNSKNGRVRLVLKMFSNKKGKTIISQLVQCTSEKDMLQRLKDDSPDAMRFLFFYAAKDNLYDGVIGDGLCSVRTGRIMEEGKLLLHTVIY